MRAETYLTHYIMQSCGWVKIAEYACETTEQAAHIQAEIIVRHPTDTIRFDLR